MNLLENIWPNPRNLSIEPSMKIQERYWMFLPCAPSCCPCRTRCHELALFHIWYAFSSGSGCLQACMGGDQPCPHDLLVSASLFSWSCPSLKIWSSMAQVMCLCQWAWGSSGVVLLVSPGREESKLKHWEVRGLPAQWLLGLMKKVFRSYSCCKQN